MNDSINAGEIKAAKPFPRFWVSVGWIVLLFAMQAICGFIAGKLYYPDLSLQQIAGKMANLKQSALPIMWSMFASGAITSTLLALYLSRKQRYHALGLDRWSEIDMVRTVALGIGLVLLGYAVNYVYAVHIVNNPSLQREMQEMFNAIPKTAVNQVMMFTAIAVLAPAIEELVFRGMLQKSISNRLGPFLGITLASLIFALSHGQPTAFVPLAVLGGIFGYLYHRTGSMRLAIALHIINNALAFLLGG